MLFDLCTGRYPYYHRRINTLTLKRVPFPENKNASTAFYPRFCLALKIFFEKMALKSGLHFYTNFFTPFFSKKSFSKFLHQSKHFGVKKKNFGVKNWCKKDWCKKKEKLCCKKKKNCAVKNWCKKSKNFGVKNWYKKYPLKPMYRHF